jgi:hypothetical protein
VTSIDDEWEDVLAGQAGADEPPPREPPDDGHVGERVPPPDDDGFWEARPALAHIRTFAYSRMAAPWPMLGVIMLRVLYTVPPWVTLPPIIGNRGSLNMLLALVGRSSSGKGAAEGAAADAVDVHHLPVYCSSPGSGEGIGHQYAHHVRREGRDELERDRDAVLFSAPEVDSLAAVWGRQGATLGPQLRSAYFGERLGFGYADARRRIILEPHSYRLGLIIGVQPARAALLLSDAEIGGGTPQRILWLPTQDPRISADPPPSPPPRSLESTRRSWKTGHLHLPEVVADEIRQAHVARQRGEVSDELDGHRLFTQEKVAVALALLDDRREMNLDDWALAAMVMAKSDQTRAMIIATLRDKQHAIDAANAHREGRKAVVVAAAVRTEAEQRVGSRLLDYLTEHGPSARHKVRKAVSGPDRHLADAALDRSIDAGLIVAERTSRGEILRRG